MYECSFIVAFIYFFVGQQNKMQETLSVLSDLVILYSDTVSVVSYTLHGLLQQCASAQF